MITNRLDLDNEWSSQDLYMKAQGGDTTIYLLHGPIVHGGTTHASYRREGLRDDLPSGRVPGRTSDPPDLGIDGGGGYKRFHGDFIGYLGFLHQGLLIGEGEAEAVARGPTP